jgi:hypothetical protein
MTTLTQSAREVIDINAVAKNNRGNGWSLRRRTGEWFMRRHMWTYRDYPEAFYAEVRETPDGWKWQVKSQRDSSLLDEGTGSFWECFRRVNRMR